MDQEGNSTASFGSSNNMAPSETTHVAMVGQTVASDMMSSVGESPAQSSESALDMVPKRDAQRGSSRSTHRCPVPSENHGFKDMVAEDCLCLKPRVTPQRESDLDRRLLDNHHRWYAQNQVGHQHQVHQVIFNRPAKYLDSRRQKAATSTFLHQKIL